MIVEIIGWLERVTFVLALIASPDTVGFVWLVVFVVELVLFLGIDSGTGMFIGWRGSKGLSGGGSPEGRIGLERFCIGAWVVFTSAAFSSSVGTEPDRHGSKVAEADSATEREGGVIVVADRCTPGNRAETLVSLRLSVSRLRFLVGVTFVMEVVVLDVNAKLSLPAMKDSLPASSRSFASQP